MICNSLYNWQTYKRQIYTNSEQNQVNSDINYHYIYQKDIEVVLSCENSNNERLENISLIKH